MSDVSCCLLTRQINPEDMSTRRKLTDWLIDSTSSKEVPTDNVAMQYCISHSCARSVGDSRDATVNNQYCFVLLHSVLETTSVQSYSPNL